MLNQSLFTAQSGDYSQITSLITLPNAQYFESIYEASEAHAIGANQTLLDYVMQGVCVAFTNIPLDAIATLKGLNLIACNDNVHIGLTALGYDYWQHIQV